MIAMNMFFCGVGRVGLAVGFSSLYIDTGFFVVAEVTRLVGVERWAAIGVTSSFVDVKSSSSIKTEPASSS